MGSNSTEPIPYVRNFYGYDPSVPLAGVYATIFAICFVVVVGLNIKFKSWFFSVIPIASLMNIIGFSLRPHSATDLKGYIFASLMVLLSPTIFAMADYSLVSRIMKKSGISHPLFTPHVVRYIFLVADIVSFIVQASGGGLLSSSDRNMAQNGARMLLGGLCLSLIVFSFFLFLTIYIHIRFLKSGAKKGRWAIIFYLLYVDMILLIIRSSYRVAEYANMEYHNSIATNEALFYTLDATEMAVLNILWIPFHPGFWDMLDTKNEIDENESKSLF